MLVATSTTADESDCRTVIPGRATDLGRSPAPDASPLRLALHDTFGAKTMVLFVRSSK